jgi:hypothetical protein
MTQPPPPTTTPQQNTASEWKIYIGQVIIGILGALVFLKNGDGSVLTAVISAEAALSGIAIGKNL